MGLMRIQLECQLATNWGRTCGALKDAHTLVHGRNAAAERLGAGYKCLAALHLQRQLANVMDSILQAQRRYGIGDQDKALGMGAICDAQRGGMCVHAVGNDAKIDGATRRYGVRGKQAHQTGITMMERQHGIEQMRDQCGAMLDSPFAVAQAGHGMAEGDSDACRHQLIDDASIVHLLRRQRYDLDPLQLAVGGAQRVQALQIDASVMKSSN